MGSLIGNLWRRGHLTILAMSSPLSPGVEVSLSSIEDIECPPQTDDPPAYFPDEDDCHVFYVCVWSKPQRMTCPGELHFDPILNVCNWAENVGCVIVDSSEEGEKFVFRGRKFLGG